MKIQKLYVALLAIMLLANGTALAHREGAGGRNGGNTSSLSKTQAETFAFNINNLYMPLNNKGVLADVDLGAGAGGKFQNVVALFSGGFYMSGKKNGELWANGVLSASRITDFQAGNVGTLASDPKNQIYVLSANDAPFGSSWQNWKTAVSMGAEFYDGDGDGIYNPVDKNGNGLWDASEDRPDLLGDVTAWCVYNDGLPSSQRRFTDVNPMGIEIRQTVFGFRAKSIIGNMLFVRYSIVNRTSTPYDSVYFAVAADPDLGEYSDDYVGCDTTISAGFVYNTTPDRLFGNNCPTLLMDFFQGPIAYEAGKTFTDVNSNGVYDAGVDIARDTAYDVRGRVRGKKAFPGARNLPLTSFTQYMQSHPTHGDPNTKDELRNYMLGGKGKDGSALNPCVWAFGNGSTITGCNLINPVYMYSGDPVANTGWLNTTAQDQRMMLNTGPFKLNPNEPINIVAAYVVGQSTEGSLKSVRTAKEIDKVAQIIFNSNFPAPPPPPPIVATAKDGNGFIDITWETSKHLKYNAKDSVLLVNKKVKGFIVNAYRVNNKIKSIDGVVTQKELAHYEVMKDSIFNIYLKNPDGGITLKREVAAADKYLDSALYADPAQGRIRLRITTDPFVEGNPLIKGKEYYFAVTQYTLNMDTNAIKNKNTGFFGGSGDYVDQGSSYEEDETAIIRVVYGSDMYSPASLGDAANQSAGAGSGAVKYLAVDNAALTGDSYTVEFFKDSASASYSTYWRLKKGSTTLLDSSKVYDFDTTVYSGKVTDGFITKVKPVTPAFAAPSAQLYLSSKPDSIAKWFEPLSDANGYGAFYVGTDIPTGKVVSNLSAANRSSIIKAERLRTVEIRFGQPSKAYRYLNGFPKTTAFLQRRGSYVFAGAVSQAADTTGGSPTQGLGEVKLLGEGFVTVPYSVWVVDKKYGEEKQLATAFIERSRYYAGGNPDGMWDPDTNLALSLEYIVVFDTPYDANGGNKVYTGGAFTVGASTSTVWADLVKGYTIPAGADGITAEQRKMAASPYFNAMYVVGLERKNKTLFYNSGDTLRIPVTAYPYTSADKFSFNTRPKGELSADQQKDIFNKVNVYPNPLFAYNVASSYNTDNNRNKADDPFVTFTNLPEEVTIKIYSLSGMLLRTLTQNDKREGVSSPFLQWDMQNEDGLRVASGMYLAIVSSPKFGEKILKLAVIMPQKQLQYY